MTSTLPDDLKVMLAHWAAYNKHECLFQVFALNEVEETLTSDEEKLKFYLRRSILDINLCMKKSVNYHEAGYMDLLLAFNAFENTCAQFDSYAGMEFYFQRLRRLIFIQLCACVLWKHLGFTDETSIQVLSPSKAEYIEMPASPYIADIDKVFELREMENETGEFSSSENSDRRKDYSSFVKDLLSNESSSRASRARMLDASKAVHLLHAYNPDMFFGALTSLTKLVETKELFRPVLKLTGQAGTKNSEYLSITKNLFGVVASEDKDDGYDSGQDRVFESFSDKNCYPKGKKKLTVLSPPKSCKVTPLGSRFVSNKRKGNFTPTGRKTNNKWTDMETDKLLIGLARYGQGRCVEIIDDPELASYLQDRDNVQIKDKVRNLLKNNIIQFE